MKRLLRLLPALVLLLLFGGCTAAPAATPTAPAAGGAEPALATVAPTPAATDAVEQLSFEIVAEYQHDPTAWTQGLVVADAAHLFEGTGDWENSRLREVELSSGQVVREVRLPGERLYGEGIALHGDRIYQITWQDGLGMIYDRSDFRLITGFRYPAEGSRLPVEGWGLTGDGTLLYMSDGTANIYVVDPEATAQSGQLQVLRTIEVTFQGQALQRLNELEYINGAIFANVWFEDVIVRIDPQSGRVSGLLDLSGLLPDDLRADADVLNGIAYDRERNLIYVTGKYWPRLYALRLIE